MQLILNQKGRVMNNIIHSNTAYDETMVTIYEFMNKGEANLTNNELNTLALLVKAAEDYEDNVLGEI